MHFFVCVLNSCITLFAVNLLFGIFDSFYVVKRTKLVACFFVLQPRFLIYCAALTPGPLSFFFSALFLSMVIKNRSLYAQMLPLLVLFQCHKIFWLPCLAVALFISAFKTKKLALKLALCLCCGFVAFKGDRLSRIYI